MLIIKKPRKKGWRWQLLKEKQNENTIKNKVKKLTNK
tara:strand:+ start:398 stop:508 length:111 start_codon:yes stop_codon:yes gene_type:complete